MRLRHHLIRSSAALVALCAGATGAHAQVEEVPDDEVVEGILTEGEEVEEGAEELGEAEPPESDTRGTVKTRARRVDGALDGKPQRVERISSEQLRRRGATNLAEALEWLSAGSPTSPTGTATGLIIDGLPGSQVVVMRDGLPVARPSGSPQGPMVDMSSVPVDPQSIERIDVYRGVGPVGSGATGGVVIDIITRRAAAEPSGFVRAQLGGTADDAAGVDGAALMAQTYSVGADVPLLESLSLTGAGRFSTNTALDVDGDTIPDAAARELAHGELALTWRPTTNSFLLGQVLATGSGTESLGGDRAPFDDLVDRQSVRARVRGRWWVHEDARLDHHTDVTRTQHTFSKRVRASGFERLKSDTRLDELNQSASLTWFLADHDLAAELGATGFIVEREGETGDLGTRRRLNTGAGLADTWYALENLELFARVYGELSTDYGPGGNAQLSMSWKAVDALTVRASASTTRRVPTPEELYLFFDHSEVGYQLQGNEDLSPERLNSTQVAAIWTSEDKRSGVEVMGFAHLIDDAIVPVQAGDDPSLFTYANLEGALTAGGQISAQARGLPGGLSVLANYTYLPVAQDADGAPLALRSTHSARTELRGGWFDRSLEVWVDAAVRSEMNVPAGATPSPAYTLLGAGVSWRPGDWGRLMLDLDNLLDQTNATWGPMPGRNARLTLELSLGG